MKKFNSPFIQLSALLMLFVFTCSFACRNNAANAGTEFSEQEILQTEKEAEEMAASKAEIDEATEKVDSLLTEIEKQ